MVFVFISQDDRESLSHNFIAEASEVFMAWYMPMSNVTKFTRFLL